MEQVLDQAAGSEPATDAAASSDQHKGGGGRIDGGEGGFAERTVSFTDIAWVLAARERAAATGTVLDESLVNPLRHLEGTPKGSTRWIDAGWAAVVGSVQN